jgi:hypothetical protein
MALYNHLFARRNQGKWILRIEDTDRVVLTFSCVCQNMVFILYFRVVMFQDRQKVFKRL